MARAMTSAGASAKGTTNEQHWRERSTALLAPLLHAAYLTDRQITQVLRWVLRADLEPAQKALEDHGAQIPADILAGIAKTDERERSSILSATAGVLSAYNADAMRRNAAHPNFDPSRFVAGTDTLYITAPAHKQALCAPLVVGLLEQLRHATYRPPPPRQHRRRAAAPCLHVPGRGRQHRTHPRPALTRLRSRRATPSHHRLPSRPLPSTPTLGTRRRGRFLSLFQTKLLISGIADTRTLEAISSASGNTTGTLISTPSDAPSARVLAHAHRHRVRHLPHHPHARSHPGRSTACHPGARCTCTGHAGG